MQDCGWALHSYTTKAVAYGFGHHAAYMQWKWEDVPSLGKLFSRDVNCELTFQLGSTYHPDYSVWCAIVAMFGPSGALELQIAPRKTSSDLKMVQASSLTQTALVSRP